MMILVLTSILLNYLTVFTKIVKKTIPFTELDRITYRPVSAVYTPTTSFQDPLLFQKHQINDSSNHYIVAENLSQSWRTDETLAYIKTAMESNHFLHCTIELTNTPEQTCYNFSLLNHQLMVLVKTFQLKENKPFAIVDKNETVRRQSSYSTMPFLVTDLPI